MNDAVLSLTLDEVASLYHEHGGATPAFFKDVYAYGGDNHGLMVFMIDHGVGVRHPKPGQCRALMARPSLYRQMVDELARRLATANAPQKRLRHDHTVRPLPKPTGQRIVHDTLAASGSYVN